MPPVRAQAVRHPREGPSLPCLDLRCPANPDDVRGVLLALRACLAASDVPEDCLSSVEIATAEALNNIVEHAFRGRDAQDIRITAALTGDRLRLCIRDRGNALPGERLPGGTRPDPTAPLDALPEGGFGWFLIRDLTDRVIYRRIGEENLLWMHFRLSGKKGGAQKP